MTGRREWAYGPFFGRKMGSTALVVGASALAVLGAAAASISPAGAAGRAVSTKQNVAVYRTPTPHALPEYIAVGSDGDVWFTEFNSRAVVRMTPQGAMKAFKVGGGLEGIVAGPDASVWVSGGEAVYGITGSGHVSQIFDEYRNLSGGGLNDIAWAGGTSLYVTGDTSSGGWVIDRVVTNTGSVTTDVTVPSGMAPEALAGSARCGVWVDLVGTNPRVPEAPVLELLGSRGVKMRIKLRRSDSPSGMACSSSGALWVADGAQLLRVGRGTHAANRYWLPLPRFSGFVSAEEVAVSWNKDVFFIGSAGVLGERAASGRFSYWPLPAGVSGGLAVDAGHGTFTVNETRSEIAVLR